MPMMPCIGVRISWLIIERKSLLICAVVSASSTRLRLRGGGVTLRRDVVHRALVVLAVPGTIPDRVDALGNPDGRAVPAVDLALEVGDAAVGPQGPCNNSSRRSGSTWSGRPKSEAVARKSSTESYP